MERWAKIPGAARASRVTSSGEEEGLNQRALSVQARGGTLLVGIRVAPSAARTEVRGLYGDRLKIAVNSPAEGGKANARLVLALAGWLGIRADQVAIQAGHSGRDKVVAFSGIMEEELRERLNRLLPDGERAR